MHRVLFAPREPLPLRPDAAGDLPRYRAWLARREAERLAAPRPVDGPAPAVVVAVENPDPPALAAGLRAVTTQLARHGHLALAVLGRLDPAGEAAVASALGDAGGRAHRVDLDPGIGTARAVAAALEQVPGDAFVVLGQHDRVVPDALGLLGAALGSDDADTPDVVYADHDTLGADGGPADPVLKPAWSPELLLSGPYFGRPVAYRRRAVDAAGGIRPLDDGDWEHDLALRVTESCALVVHVPEVLCHLVPSTSTQPGPGAVNAALERRGESAEVRPGPLPRTWSVLRRADRRASVSVVIPFRDEPRLLRTCVETVTATADDVELELVLVDNGSAEPETATLLERLGERERVTVVSDPRAFNWAALNNAAVTATNGDVLVFLNNDIEAHRRGWLAALAAQATRAEVGAVGARLIYPTGLIQHVGVVIGMGGAAGHVLAGLGADRPGYLGMAVLARDCAAVTGACLATRREVFAEVGGFDESLGLDLNDIDYCLRAADRGYRVVYEPAAELVHLESPSRGTSGSVANITRFIDRWSPLIEAGDPHLNPHLTRVDSSCALAGPEEEGWWPKWRSSLES